MRDEGEKKIRLANGEFYASQENWGTEQVTFDLVGTLIFTGPVEIACSLGTISLSVREARLVVAFNDCIMPQRNIGYRRAMADVLVTENKAETKQETSLRARLSARFGLTGLLGGAEGSAEHSRNRSESKSETSTRKQYLVSSEGVDHDAREAIWVIRCLEAGGHLEGEVFGDEEFGGRLGQVEASLEANWHLQPRLEWMPSAEIHGKDQIDYAQKVEFDKQMRNKRCFAAIVLGEDEQFEHKDFEPVLPDPKPEGDS